MADDSIKILVEFENGQKGFATIKRDAEKSGAEAGNKFSDGFASKLGIGLKTQLAAIGAIVGAALFSTKTIDAAIESEQAVTQFNRALARTGQFSKEASIGFQDFAASLQASTGIADEAILGVSTQIQNLASLSTTDLKRTTQAALDLSAALGIDLDSAATLVGKAANGQVEAFGRLGIKIREGKTDAETFTNALKTLEDRFGGASAGALNTFSGALLSAKNAFGDILEELGKLTTGSPVLVSVIKEIGKIFQEAADAVTKFGKSGDGTGELVKQLLTIGAVITDFVVRPLEVLYNISKLVFYFIATNVQAVIDLFAKLALGAAKIGSAFGLVKDSTVQTLKDIESATSETLGQFSESTQSAFDNIGTMQASDQVDAFVERLRAAAANAQPIADQMNNTVGGGFKKMAEEANKAADSINKSIQGALVNIVKQGVSRIGAALNQGGSAFGDFTKVVLNILGDLAIQIGGELVAIGLGIEALRTSLATLTGGTAIAAGLALIALGGLLKSFGGTGLSAQGAGASTPDTGGGFAPTSPVLEDQPANARRQTEVNINIEGNILDRRDSGLEIARVLQEYFDTNNGVLVNS